MHTNPPPSSFLATLHLILPFPSSGVASSCLASPPASLRMQFEPNPNSHFRRCRCHRAAPSEVRQRTRPSPKSEVRSPITAHTDTGSQARASIVRLASARASASASASACVGVGVGLGEGVGEGVGVRRKGWEAEVEPGRPPWASTYPRCSSRSCSMEASRTARAPSNSPVALLDSGDVEGDSERDCGDELRCARTAMGQSHAHALA